MCPVPKINWTIALSRGSDSNQCSSTNRRTYELRLPSRPSTTVGAVQLEKCPSAISHPSSGASSGKDVWEPVATVHVVGDISGGGTGRCSAAWQHGMMGGRYGDSPSPRRGSLARRKRGSRPAHSRCPRSPCPAPVARGSVRERAVWRAACGGGRYSRRSLATAKIEKR